VWRAALDPGPERLAALAASLCDGELGRAGRHGLEKHRRRFVAARGRLRALLGRYLATGPSEVRFVYGAHGKPALAGPESALRFSVAHSGDLALFAVALEREVGIDLEATDGGIDHAASAERFFSAGESAALRRLPAGQRAQAFYACWVRKEAYVKALGAGLSAPRGAFEAPPGSVQGFSFHGLAPGPGFCAALALEGAASVRCFSVA
jgi:4'-phosphopantetheinyl transferase